MTLTIELTNNKALALLQQLEELKLIRLLNAPKKNSRTAPIPEIAALFGALHQGQERNDEYQSFVKELRKEWE